MLALCLAAEVDGLDRFDHEALAAVHGADEQLPAQKLGGKIPAGYTRS